MSDIRIRKQHGLGKAKCDELAAQLGEQLVKGLGGTISTQPDCLVYKTMGAEGVLRTGESDIEIVIKLGLMTKAFKPMIESEIENACAKYLGS